MHQQQETSMGLSGNTKEFVMGANNFYQVSVPDTKYYNLYTTEEEYKNAELQHAMFETSGWYKDSANFIDINYKWVARGGNYLGNVMSGIFSFTREDGYGHTNKGSRSTLTIN